MAERKEKMEKMEEILDAVIACMLTAQGDELQATQVAAKAGISTRTLNRYFPEKDLMVFAASVKHLERKYQSMAEQYCAAELAGLSGRERVVRFFRTQIESLCAHPEETITYVSANIHCLAVGADKRCRRPCLGVRLGGLIVSGLEEGIRDGSVRPTLDPARAFSLISSSFNGLMQRLAFARCDETSPMEMAEAVSLLEEYMVMLEGYLRP